MISFLFAVSFQSGRRCLALGALLVCLLASCAPPVAPEASQQPVQRISSPTPPAQKTSLPALTSIVGRDSGAATPAAPIPAGDTPPAIEIPIREIPLAGPVAESWAEISGLDWFGDVLIFLPQYPERLGGNLFALDKADILGFLAEERAAPLTPRAIPLEAEGLARIPGYEGLEAIAFAGDRVFVTVETRRVTGMETVLLAGHVASDLTGIRLDTEHVVRIPAQARLGNYSDETIVVFRDSVITIYEANGANVNPAPRAHAFHFDLTPAGELAFPTVEYRVTDATAPDASGVFWVINYLFPGDLAKLDPGPDQIRERYGAGPTHAQSEIVERLVPLQLSPQAVRLAETPAVQFVLQDDGAARNWEGLVRLDDQGFLLVTDKHPRTIFGFLAYSLP